MKNTRQVIMFYIFLSFFSTGTYVYFALSRNTSYSWKMRLQRPQAPRPFFLSAPGVHQTWTVTFIPRIDVRKATRSLTSPVSPSPPLPTPCPVCPFPFFFRRFIYFFFFSPLSLRVFSPPPKCRARLLIIIHVHIITFLCIIII